jgi:aryl-alcohol dehydrogenase-like predicted oxidoreductase
VTVPRRFAIGGALAVDRIGYGAMRLTGQPGNFGPWPDWEGGKALLRLAVALGVGFVDTARSYGPGWNEKLVGEAFADGPRPVIATKGGADKGPDGKVFFDGRPETLAAQVDAALVALRVERIDLFQLHRVDPAVPIEDSVGALARACEAGKIAHVGVSNVDRDQLSRALAVTPIASVQNRYNMGEPDAEAEAIVDLTAAAGIAFLPYGPLGGDPMAYGKRLPPREAIAWLLRRSPNIVVIPGTTSPAHLRENLSAWELVETA